jgi:succinate dehydrogenase hydrophobic anchor subunit
VDKKHEQIGMSVVVRDYAKVVLAARNTIINCLVELVVTKVLTALMI